jgi:hypothetical protein
VKPAQVEWRLGLVRIGCCMIHCRAAEIRRRPGRAGPSADSAGALAPQEPPKSRECPTGSG